MAQFNSSVEVRHDSVTVNQHAQHQDPETEAAKLNHHYFLLLCFPTVLLPPFISLSFPPQLIFHWLTVYIDPSLCYCKTGSEPCSDVCTLAAVGIAVHRKPTGK